MKNKEYNQEDDRPNTLRAQQWRSITELLGELDGPGVGVDVGGVEAGESGGAGEVPELPLVPLLAAGVVGEHDHVDVEHPLLPRRRVGALRQHALHHHHLPVLRQRVVAVPQQPRAVLVAPVVEDPLHQDGVAAAGHGGEHVAADVLHPRERRRLGDDVGEVVVDPPDVRVARDDGGHGGSHAAADVDDGGGGVEAGVEVEQLLGDDDGVTRLKRASVPWYSNAVIPYALLNGMPPSRTASLSSYRWDESESLSWECGVGGQNRKRVDQLVAH
uniref:Uncharacterized protein n=1 Tax=Oryza meridionalis TaxID=40149 RepID=A0A0E0EI39_9ORYZ